MFYCFREIALRAQREAKGRYEHLDLQMDRYGASHECHADEARDHDGPDRRAVEVRRLRRLRRAPNEVGVTLGFG